MSSLHTDLDHVLAHTLPVWEQLRGARILITGGTGFFGRWLVESFCRAADELNLAASAVVVTRHPERFFLRHSAVSAVQGDIARFSVDGSFSHVIHAASASHDQAAPEAIRETIVNGTSRVLEVARNAGARRVLFTSSGAVYGRQGAGVTHITEEMFLDQPPQSPAEKLPYAQAKRAAEKLCADSGIDCVIARGFAFVGPYLPLDANFAVGNFLRDALGGGPIVVKGDGTAVRSYLYAADLAIWLWTLLTRGQPERAYNVGSEEALTIRQLAQSVAKLAPGLRCEIRGEPGIPGDRYVPSTRRARTELGLEQWIPLPDGLARTFEFLKRSACGPR